LKSPILPGATIGVLGSGQLGRMFAIAARRMGYRVHTYSPDYDTPTGQVADVEVSAPYDDLDAVKNFAEGVDVMTFEFENVPAATAKAAAERSLVRPAGHVLHVTQHRLREKTFLESNGFPVTPFIHATVASELEAAAEKLGDVIAKTAGWGYDGKGQVRIKPGSDVAAAWTRLDTTDVVVEKVVDFECEASVIVARSVTGDTAVFELTRNDHVRHILDVSHAPSLLPERIRLDAFELARAIAAKLELVGLLCVELFVVDDRTILVNELAPRPHNSGHWTFDACVTSQFEQQLRAVCALPLGSTELLRPAAMANLLGDLWEEGEPDWARACSDPDVKLHLYGKLEARPGRKMGHLTAVAATPEEAARKVREARDRAGRAAEF
jgi:5-(carboxyamino)imidazole ribonucleotide synthase